MDSTVKPFILNWLDSSALTDDWSSEYVLALEYLTNHGTERDRQTAIDLLSAWGGEPANSSVGRSKQNIRRGASISMSDCWSVELAVGNLLFHVVEYGDAIHLPYNPQGLLNVGCSTERSQCACLSLDAGAEWILQHCPNRVPCASRVNCLASQIRWKEFELADRTHCKVPKKGAPYPFFTSKYDA